MHNSAFSSAQPASPGTHIPALISASPSHHQPALQVGVLEPDPPSGSGTGWGQKGEGHGVHSEQGERPWAGRDPRRSPGF